MDDQGLLRCLVQVIGRAAVPAEQVRNIVGTGKNRVKAFNLFDGSRGVTEVAHQTKINQGNLSRAAKTWVEQGIAFWIGDGNEARLLHIYPIPPISHTPRKGARKK